MPPRSRSLLFLVVTAILVACLLLGMLWALRAERAAAQSTTPSDAETDTIAVIVQLDDHAALVRSVDARIPVSGLVALQASGLDLVVADSGFGPAVCAIQGVGCPADDCFCQCDGGDTCAFWNYLHWEDDGWRGYEVGPGGSTLLGGAVEGWRWGESGALMTPATSTLAADAVLGALAATQARNGGYGGTGSDVETLLAIGANGQTARTWRADPYAGSLWSAIIRGSGEFVQPDAIGPSAAGKLAVAAAATEMCWPLDTLTPSAFYSDTLGAYSVHPGINAWAILGAAAFEDDIPAPAVDGLIGSIQPNGGWEWMTGFGADTNSTAVAIQALVAVGEPITSSAVISGLAFLRAAQNDDGGFGYDPATATEYGSDANSTAYAVQAIYAMGDNPNDDAWSRGPDGATPLDFLLTAMLDDGTVEWQPGSGANLLATQQAVPALLGRSYPLTTGVRMCRSR
jgi:hypothetical protein